MRSIGAWPSVPTPRKRSPSPFSPERLLRQACYRARAGDELARLPGDRVGEIGRAVVLIGQLAEVVTCEQQPARGAATRAALDHDGLRAAPLDGHAHAYAGCREVRFAQPRIRVRGRILVVVVPT